MNTVIRILSTSDVHGTLYPYTYARGGDQKQSAWHGLARLSTLIKKMRDENTILIDNGDTIEGSPLTFFHYLCYPDKNCPISTAMRAMHYDYVNVGNHDFNYGPQAVFNHVLETGATCITSNFFYREEAVGKPYVLRRIAEKTLAIVGVTTQHIPHWEKPDNLRDIRFEDAFDTVRRTVGELRRKDLADYILVVYHGGFENEPETGEPIEKKSEENEAYRMLEEIEGIDAIITGHQHRLLCGTLFGTAYVQPLDKGQYLSCVEIDTATGKVTAKAISVEGVEPDNALLALVQAEEDECQSWLDRALGESKVDLKVTDENDARLHKSQLITFLNNVQRERTGAEVAAASVFLGSTGFDKKITMRALVGTYIYPNTLTVKRMSGKALRAYLEKCAAYWCVRDGQIVIDPKFDFPTPQHYNYDMLDGIEYTLKVSNPVGKRVVRLTKDGKDIGKNDRLTVCVNSYRASGGGGFDMVAESPTVKEDLTSMVDVMAEYILKHKVIDFKPVHNIELIV